MRNNFFHKKIPRAKLYLKFSLILKALAKTLAGDLKSTELVSVFEREFASHCNASHSLAIAHARTAFFYILKALNLPPNSEVLMTPITIVDMVNAVQLAGLKPVFIDIEKETLNIDPDEVKKKVTGKSKVLLATHLFGITPNMDKIVKIAKEYNLILIEDFSQSFGCKYGDRFLGTFGRAGFCTLSWIKTISTFYGGMIITEDKDFLNQIKVLSNQQPFPKRGLFIGIILKSLIFSIATQNYIFSFITYYILKLFKRLNPQIVMKVIGGNDQPSLRSGLPQEWFYRFNKLQAWVGLEILKTVKVEDEKRRRNVRVILDNLLPVSKVHLPQETKDRHNIYWRLPLVSENITDFQKYLFKKNIDSCATSLYVCSNIKVFDKFKRDTPKATFFRENMTYIPVHPTLESKDMIYIAEMINNYFNSKQQSNDEQKT